MTDSEVYETWSKRRRPEHLQEHDAVMTNFDHTIDEGAEQLLAETPTFAQYSAWDFCGYVWFEAAAFHCEVWQHNAYVETASAPSLSDIMQEVSDRYGVS